ncbi:hypothetical protein FA09DRAFT_29319 [Tilletiopsis washingtonensis]|uniref:Uncharacterized protein n=1 Tax=Tilletiopsis washingtonensis TaxID=58919 RepID=A0A316ZC90_9BASI|nr:hypothetical protein FA09DRAFT_29319 [Tilletiopsis washingtonensis]PWN97853.1 hypothetical protein FA09DRAFT_29319 [Tilletiopsis washingtonensis]
MPVRYKLVLHATTWGPTTPPHSRRAGWRATCVCGGGSASCAGCARDPPCCSAADVPLPRETRQGAGVGGGAVRATRGAMPHGVSPRSRWKGLCLGTTRCCLHAACSVCCRASALPSQRPLTASCHAIGVGKACALGETPRCSACAARPRRSSRCTLPLRLTCRSSSAYRACRVQRAGVASSLAPLTCPRRGGAALGKIRSSVPPLLPSCVEGGVGPMRVLKFSTAALAVST